MSLVLSRKDNQSIVLYTSNNEQIIVTVRELTGAQVKLAFDAPDSVLIVRDELLKDELN